MTSYVAALGTGNFHVNAVVGAGLLEPRVKIFYPTVTASTSRLLPGLEKVRVNPPSLKEAREE